MISTRLTGLDLFQSPRRVRPAMRPSWATDVAIQSVALDSVPEDRKRQEQAQDGHETEHIWRLYWRHGETFLPAHHALTLRSM